MKRSIIIALHVGYWLLFGILLMSFFLLIIASQPKGFPEFSEGLKLWMRVMLPLAVSPAVVGFYGGYHFLFPRFLAKKKIAALFGFGFLTIVLTSVCGALTLELLYPELSILSVEWSASVAQLTLMAFMGGINVVIGLVMRGFITSYADISTKEEMQRRNHAMELALVKSQFNPHFLFNTLNNIDVLISRDAEKASQYLIQLSDILRYMLYEAKDEPVPLSVELDYIDRYMALQRIRTSISDYATVEMIGSPESITVYPLLFLPFIENAFKYAEYKKEERAVQLKWLIEKKAIHFSCINTYSALRDHHDTGAEGGLGNELMRKRLNVLYPQHTLRTTITEHHYRVDLILPI